MQWERESSVRARKRQPLNVVVEPLNIVRQPLNVAV